VVIPGFEHLPPAEWPNTGILFWMYVTTVPLTLLTLASLVAAWRMHGPMRGWYLSAAGIVLVERVATFAYFIPTMVRLTGAADVDVDVKAALSQWQLANHGRHLLTLAGWLLATRALSLSGRRV
jgi:hypothetical protein